MAAAGADIVKVGLSAHGRGATLQRLAELDLAEVLLVGVLLADDGVDLDLVEPARRAGFAGLMLDTADKRRGALPDMVPPEALKAISSSPRTPPACSPASPARCAPSTSPACWSWPPTSSASAAACAGAAIARPAIDPDAVRAVRRAIPFCDSRVPLGGCYGAAPERKTWHERQAEHLRAARRRHLDRIFVRGLVLPIAIGVYDEEQGITQKVRFTIEASVAAGVSPKGDDIDEVPSYDDLVGAVKAIVAAGHINLVETLAARIADRCLADKRIVSVLVRVEKLERGPDAVGVEIVRSRAP